LALFFCGISLILGIIELWRTTYETQTSLMASFNKGRLMDLLEGVQDEIGFALFQAQQGVDIVVKERPQARSARVSVHHFIRTRRVVPV
jgi:hypothetical protein